MKKQYARRHTSAKKEEEVKSGLFLRFVLCGFILACIFSVLAINAPSSHEFRTKLKTAISNGSYRATKEYMYNAFLDFFSEKDINSEKEQVFVPEDL